MASVALRWRSPRFWLGLMALFLGAPSAFAQSEAGIFEDRILFGQSAAFEGPAASLGLGLRAGILIAFREANRNGGVHGRLLDLTSYDDSYEPEKAIVNTRRLIDDDGVFALVGEVGTPTSRAAQPIADEFDVPFIGPFTGARFLRDVDASTVINLRASYDQEAEELVRHLTEDLGLSRIAILYQDDSFGRTGLEGIVAALERRELEPAADYTYMRNTVAVKRAVLAIRRADPEAVLIVGAYKPASAFISLANEVGVDAVYGTLSFVGSKALVEELGPDEPPVIVSQVMPLYNDSTVPLVNDYRDALEAEGENAGTDISWAEDSFVGLEGYAVGRLIIEVLNDLGPEPTRAAFLQHMEDQSTFDLGGFELVFGPGDNQGSDSVFLTTTNPDDTFSYVERTPSQ